MSVNAWLANNVHLEVQEKPTEPYNRVANPSGDLGGWGYMSTPTFDRTDFDVVPDPGGAGNALRIKTRDSETLGGVWSNYSLVRAGQWVSGRVQLRTLPAGARVYLRLVYRSLADDGFPPANPTGQTQNFSNPGLLRMPPVQMVGAALVALTLYVEWRTVATADKELIFRDFVMQFGDTEADVLNQPVPPPTPWVDRIDPVGSIKVSRAEINLGTLAAEIRSSALDPAASAVLRGGRPLRLTAPLDGVQQPIYTGRVDDAPVSYALADPDPTTQARIELTATDGTADLANETAGAAVWTIPEIPHIFYVEGQPPNLRLPPWNVNGNTSAVRRSSVTEVYDDDGQSKILDQIVLARDSSLGYVWVSKDGWLTARDANQMLGLVGTLTEDDFGDDIDLGFELASVVNIVNVVVRRRKSSTDPTPVDVPQKPVYDFASVEEWGARPATYIVQGFDTYAEVRAFARKIFAANAQPVVRVNKLTLSIASAADAVRHKSHLELYDQLRIVCPTKGVDQLVRVASIEHDITPERWLMTVGFMAAGQVATPQTIARL